MSAGTLFTEDFLLEGIDDSPDWQAISDQDLDLFRSELCAAFALVANPSTLNEAQTEERIVRPVLSALGWGGAFAVQTTLDRRGRRNVSDYTLFANEAAFARADALPTSDAKLKHAVAVGDAKAWSVGLDDPGQGAGRGETPAAQTIRYLLAAEIASDRAVRWAVLTNGRNWRLYYGGARSLIDDTFEVDLAAALALPGTQLSLAGSRMGADPRRLLKVFLVMFRRAAFAPTGERDRRTFHEYALDLGRRWEAKVRDDLASVVFREVYPGLVRGLAAADPSASSPPTPAYLAEVSEAAMTVLYRLLFALYAEDRDLLPPDDPRFVEYALSTMRDEVAELIDRARPLSGGSRHFWNHAVDLFRIIDQGDAPLGVPPYNGGLFKPSRSPMLTRAPLADAIFAPLLDFLSRTDKGGRRVRINYRDLSVRELGAIYERLLEYEPVPDASAPAGIAIRLNAFGRKGSGSYYTPDELVGLIITRTVGPLVEERLAAFRQRAAALASDKRPVVARLADLAALDPASRILDLKVCDPAMGSGHFLVALVDALAEHVFTATGQAAAAVTWASGGYTSPLLARLSAIRERITAEAFASGWKIKAEQLTDANLIKRMVLKRCVYGVDKNPMAVELAKVAMWLHTFTAGAPLSFLDHHLRCGDSLFGERVRGALDELEGSGGLFIVQAVREAEAAVRGMATVEDLTDAEIAEVRASEAAFADVGARTAPLTRFLDLWQALKWFDLDQAQQVALRSFLDAAFGDPVRIAAGLCSLVAPEGASAKLAAERETMAGLIEAGRAVAVRERFLHWQAAFPGVWRNWTSTAPEGGFDAIVGNPPWDRMKMQEVEWFAERASAIAREPRAADRKRSIATLKTAGDRLAAQYEVASARAERAMQRARRGGDYPLLSRGDVNLYSLFVERVQALIKPSGIAGLLTPSGIAADLSASRFFKSVSETGRVLCLFDFENGKRAQGGAFFPDVHRSFKFCTLVVGGRERRVEATECGFFLQDDPAATPLDRLFRFTAADFARVNPNTGTAPIFRTARDAEITKAIYARLPVLVDRSTGGKVAAWPVRYVTMFHMTNDSGLFWTRDALNAAGSYRVEGGKWRKGEEEWLPLYVGRMVRHFDHRAASVTVNAVNVHNAALSGDVNTAEKINPAFVPTPQYWVRRADIPEAGDWSFGFRDIARSTDERTAIGAIIPTVATGNTLPLVLGLAASDAAMFNATFSSFIFDFVARQKIQSTHLNWYIVEQLPVPPPNAYERRFGRLTAGEIARDAVLRLTYTANDMMPFARALGYVDEAGIVRPPIRWNDAERRQLRARLDALQFHLFGVTDEDDIRYILDTFPIVRRHDKGEHGCYLTRDLILWHVRALAAGDPTALAPEAELIREAREVV